MQDSFEEWAKTGAEGLQDALMADQKQQMAYQEAVVATEAANAASASAPPMLDAMGAPLPPAPPMMPPPPPVSPLRSVSPLVVQIWHNPGVHLRERENWMNSDQMSTLTEQMPELGLVVTEHMKELQEKMGMLAPPPPPGPPPAPPSGAAGAGQAMATSNSNAGSPTIGGNTEGNEV